MRAGVRIAVAASKALARLHRWWACAAVLARVPLAELDETSVGRLRYALMMANRVRPAQTQAAFGRLVQRAGIASPELCLELAMMATSLGLSEMAATLLERVSQQATNADTADAAGRLLRLNRMEALGTLRPALGAAIDGFPLQQAGMLTLVPVSGKYLELWQLWLQQVRLHACRVVVAMVMDDAALAALQGEPDVLPVDVREYFSWSREGRLHPHTRGVLWYLRVLLLQELVRRGHPVLVLDLDAIPVGDVIAMLSALEWSDVVAQQDHSIPKDVDRQLGFVLCCGFMLWRPTTPALRLLERFGEEAALERDDQLALNHMLAANGITHRVEADGELHFESCGVGVVCPADSRVSRTMVSGSVVRHFHQTGQGTPEIRAALGL